MEYTCVYAKIDSVLTGQRIRELMAQQHVTVKALSNSLGVSNQAAYKWLNGQALPSLDNALQISRILNVSIDDIIVTNNTLNYLLPEIYVRDNVDTFYFNVQSVNKFNLQPIQI